MQQKQSQEVILFYHSLLSAEKAGVEVLSRLLHEIEDNNFKIILGRFLRDEGMNCQILSTLIKNSGEEPGKTTGDFVQKVQSLEKIEDKINLLIRGQEWVAKQIRRSRSLFIYGSEAVFMEAVKIQHEENVDSLKLLLGSS